MSDEKLPTPGLPDELPQGERLLWQGRPDWRAMAIDVFHVRKIAMYFAILMAWTLATGLHDGKTAAEAATDASALLPVALAAILLLVGLAWLAARTTTYTVTTKRVVLRIGIALSMMVNVPFKIVESAAVKFRKDGTGDIALKLEAKSRAGYLVLWPHARRWRFARPEPTLRSIPDARRVADLMAEALAAMVVEPAVQTAPTPIRAPEPIKPPVPANGLAVARAAS